MMRFYLKGYYGFKNFGDELLLLGVINYLVENYGMQTVIIETPDPKRLEYRLQKHQHFFPSLNIQYVSGFLASLKKQLDVDYICIGGGEVITDARSIPHNGWNYLLRNYRTKIFGKKIILLGGFGTPIYFGSGFLYRLLYRFANNIICREDASYKRVKAYINSDRVILHTDFSYSILNCLIDKINKEVQNERYAIINCNPYIWSLETKEKIISRCKQGNYDRLIYFPAELTIDRPMYSSLKEELPSLERYDWTQHSLSQIANLFGGSSGGIAARLHVLILLDYRKVPYTPLVYQEKITKILGHE